MSKKSMQKERSDNIHHSVVSGGILKSPDEISSEGVYKSIVDEHIAKLVSIVNAKQTVYGPGSIVYEMEFYEPVISIKTQEIVGRIVDFFKNRQYPVVCNLSKNPSGYLTQESFTLRMTISWDIPNKSNKYVEIAMNMDVK